MRVVAAMAVILALGSTADAGPFRRYVSRSTTTSRTGDACGVTSSTTRTTVRGATATAQGVAEIQAAEGRMGHRGGNRGFEGVGVGSTPEAALANCCDNGGAVIDQGVALGADGRWYACKRYR
jgi:hypothetical protein